MVKLLARLSHKDESRLRVGSTGDHEDHCATHSADHHTQHSVHVPRNHSRSPFATSGGYHLASTSKLKLEQVDSSIHFLPSPSSTSSFRAGSREPWDRPRPSTMAESRILPLPVRHGVTLNPDCTPATPQSTSNWAPSPPQFTPNPYPSLSPALHPSSPFMRSDARDYVSKPSTKHKRSLSASPSVHTSSLPGPPSSSTSERPAKRQNRLGTPQNVDVQYYEAPPPQAMKTKVKSSTSRMPTFGRLISPFRLDTEDSGSAPSPGKSSATRTETKRTVVDDCVECDDCGKSVTVKYLPKHKKRHLSPEEKASISFQCRYCDYTALEKYPVRIHERSHTKEKPCMCQECPARFGDPASLHRHRKTQHGRIVKPLSPI